MNYSTCIQHVLYMYLKRREIMKYNEKIQDQIETEIRLTDYAKKRYQKDQTIGKYITRHPDLFKDNTKRNGRTVILEPAAVKILDLKYQNENYYLQKNEELMHEISNKSLRNDFSESQAIEEIQKLLQETLKEIKKLNQPKIKEKFLQKIKKIIST